MENRGIGPAFVLGVLVSLGLAVLGHQLAGGIVAIKTLERRVEVKGLSERDVPANIAIWPIRFREADNDLGNLFSTIQRKNAVIVDFLRKNGFEDSEISTSAPAIVDKQAQDYESSGRSSFRYSGSSTVNVYTERVDQVRTTMGKLVDLGKQGIAITGDDYQARTVFLYTKLNEIKPAMIEEATTNARAVAEKFAQDSKSRLGKIKSAYQGQFSIDDRDSNTPFIKKVRVVSTVEYYLSD